MSLAPGHYKARALEGDFGFAGTGTKQVAVGFEIIDDDARGERVTWYGFFTPNTAERTIESLRHCGCVFPHDCLDDLTGLGSAEVELVLEDEPTDRGDVKSRVRWVNRIGGGVALQTRMNDAEKRAFSDEMRGYVAASRPPGQSAAQAAPASRANAAPQNRQAPPQRPARAAPSPAPNGPPQRGSMNTGDDAPPY